MNRRILVFGASGVGKSTYCKKTVKKIPGFARLSIGELLSERASAPRNFGRDAVLRHQRKLPALVNQAVSLHKAILLLEGHLIVSTETGPTCVPTEVVARLKPAALLLLYARPDVILARRLRRGDRVGPFETDKIRCRQAETMRLTKIYARQLALPMLSLNITFRREVSREILNLSKR